MTDLVIAEKADLVSIADAIREKAGSEDGLTLDAMAAAIEALETGGGVVYGTFTPSEDITDYLVTHNFGNEPVAAFWGIAEESFENFSTSQALAGLAIKYSLWGVNSDRAYRASVCSSSDVSSVKNEKVSGQIRTNLANFYTISSSTVAWSGGNEASKNVSFNANARPGVFKAGVVYAYILIGGV